MSLPSCDGLVISHPRLHPLFALRFQIYVLGDLSQGLIGFLRENRVDSPLVRDPTPTNSTWFWINDSGGCAENALRTGR